MLTSGPLLIVAAKALVLGLRRDTGVEVWRYVYKTTFLGMEAGWDGPVELAIHGTRVYALIRDRIVCLEYATGVVVGEIVLPVASMRAVFLVDGEHLYMTASDRVMCFDFAGKLVWQTPHGLTLTSGAAMGVPGNVRQGDERT